MRITPSILSADFTRLGEEIERIASADAIHVDVMDGHFVPNLSVGLPVVKSLRAATPRMLDVHLMIEDPDRWAPAYAQAGADSVTFHIEAARAPIRLARALRECGARAGVALSPATPIESILALLEEVDMVLVMSVEPGFGAQKFMDLVLSKVSEIRRRITAADLDVWIQMDGGISAQTITSCVEAGADTFVAGAAVFSADDPDQMVRTLRDLANHAQASMRR